MSWGDLFDRAAEYDATLEDVRAAVSRRRSGERTGDEDADREADDDGGRGS